MYKPPAPCFSIWTKKSQGKINRIEQKGKTRWHSTTRIQAYYYITQIHTRRGEYIQPKRKWFFFSKFIIFFRRICIHFSKTNWNKNFQFQKLRPLFRPNNFRFSRSKEIVLLKSAEIKSFGKEITQTTNCALLPFIMKTTFYV